MPTARYAIALQPFLQSAIAQRAVGESNDSIMLPNILSDYLDRVEQVIQQCSNIDVERYEEEILTPIRANLRIRSRFNKTYLLEINEAIVVADNQYY